MDVAEIRKLIRVMREHGILELELQDRRGRVRLVRENGGRDAGPSHAGRESAAHGPESAPYTVTAPMVGTFYRGPGPDAAPFVQPGGVVERGQVLCVIEAMKMVNEIAAEIGGRVLRVLVDDGAPVEYGAPLFLLEPS